MLHKVTFIVNPHSGTGNQGLDQGIIQEYLGSDWHVDIVTTEYAGHARELCAELCNKVDVIVAVGGDGTVHEIAASLVDSTTSLAIIPRGSGNGLSLFLQLPAQVKEALKVIKQSKTRRIDAISINDHIFVNMAGVGFDAHIAHLFKDFGKRGFFSYGKLVLKEFSQYPGVKLNIKMNGSGELTEEPFVVSFANSSQYGNNAHIAPGAIIDDGLLDVCVVDKFPLISSCAILLKLFTKSLNRSKYYKHYQVPEVVIQSDSDLLAHVDGEPINIGKKATLKVIPQCINVIIP